MIMPVQRFTCRDTLLCLKLLIDFEKETNTVYRLVNWPQLTRALLLYLNGSFKAIVVVYNLRLHHYYLKN
jgi:hypothetical protein